MIIIVCISQDRNLTFDECGGGGLCFFKELCSCHMWLMQVDALFIHPPPLCFFLAAVGCVRWLIACSSRSRGLEVGLIAIAFQSSQLVALELFWQLFIT
jgi:hypothetical protein